MIWTSPSTLRRLPAALLASILFLTAPLLAAGESAPGYEEIAPGIHVRAGLVAETTPDNHGAIANLGFIVGADSVAMIDSGGSVADGEAALAAIRAVTDMPVRYLINTHMHPDHVFGNQVFAAAGVTIIGHAKLPAALGARAEHYRSSMREQLGPEAAEAVTVTLPGETVADTRRLDLGGRILELRAWPTAHTDNDLTVFDEQTGTLFAGDLVFMAHVPVLDGSLKGWLARIGDLRDLPAERVVPGHGPASAPWPQALEAEAAYLEALAADLRAAIAAGVPLSEAVETAGAGEAGRWEVFDAFNARNATAGFAELEWE
ncbi:quinoprotein relay system zinc metallohydrolase 2 [Aurantimonas coralicida]|uniref:quinoprotein relay system zinc metallohydrolase 2 n=1 Tax=Aurantimonas coralicida TaxID=182270 RepID=UPI001E3CDE20|nr:quinoprotein relay system zinc metallohydrolase 2 [Aurantimonas coralicida]